MPPSGSMPDDAPSTSAPVSLGTSIVAVTFNGGVILGAVREGLEVRPRELLGYVPSHTTLAP